MTHSTNVTFPASLARPFGRGLAALAATLALGTGVASAADVDLGIRFEAGRFVTAGWDHDNGVLLGDQRVFGGFLGLVASTPAAVFGDEPGWGAPAGTFPTDGSLTITMRASLRYFDGINLGAIAFAATSTRLVMANNLDPAFPGESSSILSPAADPANPEAADPTRQFTVAAGPSFAGAEPAGGMHRHLWNFLQAPSLDANDVASGFYLMEYHLEGTFGARSLPFYTVFAYGDSVTEESLDTVIQWVDANIVPAPGAAAMLALGGLIAGRRRRSR